MHYVLSIVGWEDYTPYWFDCDCSKEDFFKEVGKAVDSATKIIIKRKLTSYLIEGEDIMKKVIPLLKKVGIRHIKPDYEIRLCSHFYIEGSDENQDKPKFMSDDVWEALKDYNKKERAKFRKEDEEWSKKHKK